MICVETHPQRYCISPLVADGRKDNVYTSLGWLRLANIQLVCRNPGPLIRPLPRARIGYHPTVRFGLNTSDSEIIVRGSIRLVSRSPHRQNRARADYNAQRIHIRFSTCIRALCGSATAASLPPDSLPSVFHARRIFYN